MLYDPFASDTLMAGMVLRFEQQPLHPLDGEINIEDRVSTACCTRATMSSIDRFPEATTRSTLERPTAARAEGTPGLAHRVMGLGVGSLV